MKIAAALLDGSLAGWPALLRQEGLAFEAAAPGSRLDEYSIAIAFGGAGDADAAGLGAYVRSGGSLLCSGRVYGRLMGIPVPQRSIAYLRGGEGEFSGSEVIDLYTACDAIPRANILPDHRGKPTGYIGTLGAGNVIVLPFDPAETFTDHRRSTKSFPARSRRLPFETVSMVSHGTVRRLLGRSLELLHHRRNLPYIHRWYYPSGAASVAAFRIDTDGTDADSLSILVSALRRHAVPATWFLDLKSQEINLPVYRTLQGDEFGIHGYEHRVYSSPDTARDDIRRAAAVLHDAGLRFSGCAFPFGFWTPSYQEVPEEIGLEYSSEFSYDYDNLPSYPLAGGRESGVLQIPIHPISIGSLRRQGFNGDEMTAYYIRNIRRSLAVREPVMIYHHPLNRHEEVIGAFAAEIRNLGIPWMTMGAIASWWKRRNRAFHSAAIEQGELRVETANWPEEARLRISRPGRMETIAVPGDVMKLPAGAFTRPPEIPSDPDGLERTRKFNPWIPVIRFQDLLHHKLSHR